MTAKDFDLAVLFLRNVGRLLSRTHIHEAVWGMTGASSVHRQPDLERGAAAGLARRDHRPAVHVDERLHHASPSPRPRRLYSNCPDEWRDTSKPVKNGSNSVRQRRRLDADAGVG